MAGDLKVSFLHRWVWLGPENKGLGLWMRQGDGSGSGARFGEEDGQTGPGSGVAGGGSCEVDNYTTTVEVTELRNGRAGRGRGRAGAGDRYLAGGGAQSRVCASGM